MPDTAPTPTRLTTIPRHFAAAEKQRHCLTCSTGRRALLRLPALHLSRRAPSARGDLPSDKGRLFISDTALFARGFPT
jgi:hypothetical protein